MRLKSLKKESSHITGEVTITLEVVAEKDDLEKVGYKGYDLLPDRLIPRVLEIAAKLVEKTVKS